VKSLLVLGALGMALSAVSAQKPVPPSPKPDKKICRREDVIGSNIPAHICLTKAEWAQLNDYYEQRDQGFIDRRDQRQGVLKSGTSPQ
jgi:hypothetical protein